MDLTGSVLLYAVGDVLIRRAQPESSLVHIRDLFSQADIRFGNCEVPYTNTEEINPAVKHVLRSDPEQFAAVAALKFDVMSFANNNALDCGYAGFFETIELMKGAHIRVVGAGENAAAARHLVIITRHGVRVGFLAYTCQIPPGFEAGAAKPGCATIEVHTIFNTRHEHQGTVGDVFTVANPRDRALMIEEVRRARQQVDLLAISMHWGLGSPATVSAIPEYERELGQAAIAAGADVILGHAQHLVKGIEVVGGKPIFHGLGDFIFDNPVFGQGPDHSRSMVASISATREGITEIGLRPICRDGSGNPVALEPGSSQFADYLSYLRRVTAEAGFSTAYTADGPEIWVELD